jgi:hypothetical protein
MRRWLILPGLLGAISANAAVAPATTLVVYALPWTVKLEQLPKPIWWTFKICNSGMASLCMAN